MKIKLECKNCGKEPQKDESNSNKNWDTFNMVCGCGERLSFKYE